MSVADFKTDRREPHMQACCSVEDIARETLIAHASQCMLDAVSMELKRSYMRMQHELMKLRNPVYLKRLDSLTGGNAA